MDEKLYEKAVEQAKKELSDELFLGFYKKSSLTSKSFEDLLDAQIHYSAILDMKQDKSWGECEAAYEIGIKNVAKDILDIVNSWKISLNELKVGSIFYTKEISDMMNGNTWHHGHKWEVKEVQRFNPSLESSKSFFVVQEKNYNGCICEPETEDFKTTTFFTDKELDEFGYDDNKRLEAEIKYFDENDPARIKELKQYADMFTGLEEL